MRSKLAGVAAVFLVVPTILVTVGWGAFGATNSQWREKVDPSVLAAAETEATDFLVFFKARADLRGAESLGWNERGWFVYERLTATAKNSQAALLADFDRIGVRYQSFFSANLVAAKGSLAAIEAAAARPEVEHVYAMGSGSAPRPQAAPSGSGDSAAGPARTAVVEGNIIHVKAPQAWVLGATGTGAVVAGADTGVRWTHNALKLKYRGWDAATSTANHDYNWKDGIPVTDPANLCPTPPPRPEPCDDDNLLGGGHGTHTMGTIVGDDGSANQIGMAPGAKWIACRNMERGLGVVPTYMACMDWFLAPTKIDGSAPDPTKRPHVTNNSWGCVEACPPPALQAQLQAARAAGVFYAVSAGNDGPACSTIANPLARYPEAFSVGATEDPSDAIADFSSRGPTLGDPTAPAGLQKPNISAPGVNVRSSLRSTDTSYGSLSGTSMAGPHVAGLVALLIDADPSLAGDINGLEDIIEQTAVNLFAPADPVRCGDDTATSDPNYVFGHGRIDALAAVTMALPPTVVRVVSFGAAKTRAGVKVSWRTGSYIGAVGFNVWRSTKPNGQYRKLNRALIETKTQTAPASYSYLDRTVRRGQAYFYKLQLVRVQGSSVWAGPTRASSR